MFRQKLGEVELGEGKVQEEWERLEGRIKLAVEGTEREREERREERKGWWNKECKEKKKELRKTLRIWKRGGEGQGQEYRRRRRKYRDLCERKKRKENEKWARRAAEVRTEGQVWEIVNKERKRRKRVNEGIEMREWKNYYSICDFVIFV